MYMYLSFCFVKMVHGKNNEIMGMITDGSRYEWSRKDRNGRKRHYPFIVFDF